MNIHSIPQDNTAYRFPVSIKGVLVQENKVLLLKNERDEWELPGGKLELGEEPPVCLKREIHEELNLAVAIGPILHSWIYTIAKGVHVLIVTYGCIPTHPILNLTHSSEHKAVGFFDLKEVSAVNMPEGYKQSILAWTSGKIGRQYGVL